MEVRLPANMKVGAWGSCPVREAGSWVGLPLGRARAGTAAQPSGALPSPTDLPRSASQLPLWKPRGLLTWGHQREGAALDTNVIFSLALEPVRRLGQWEREVGRLPVVRSLLHVHVPILSNQAVGDGWAARHPMLKSSK